MTKRLIDLSQCCEFYLADGKSETRDRNTTAGTYVLTNLGGYGRDSADEISELWARMKSISGALHI